MKLLSVICLLSLIETVDIECMYVKLRSIFHFRPHLYLLFNSDVFIIFTILSPLSLLVRYTFDSANDTKFITLTIFASLAYFVVKFFRQYLFVIDKSKIFYSYPLFSICSDLALLYILFGFAKYVIVIESSFKQSSEN